MKHEADTYEHAGHSVLVSVRHIEVESSNWDKEEALQHLQLRLKLGIILCDEKIIAKVR